MNSCTDIQNVQIMNTNNLLFKIPRDRRDAAVGLVLKKSRNLTNNFLSSTEGCPESSKVNNNNKNKIQLSRKYNEFDNEMHT